MAFFCMRNTVIQDLERCREKRDKDATMFRKEIQECTIDFTQCQENKDVHSDICTTQRMSCFESANKWLVE